MGIIFSPEHEMSCHDSGFPRVVTFMFDLGYLDVPAELIVEYRLKDTKRIRPKVSIRHVAKWQTSWCAN
jgi:hypothetical protein